MAAWFVVSKYFKSSDADKIKQRLTGVGKARKKTKEEQEPASSPFIHTQQGGNKFAQLLVEKYQLGPKIAVVPGASRACAGRPRGWCICAHGVRRRDSRSPG